MAADIAEVALELARRFADRLNAPMSIEDETTLKSLGIPIADEVLVLLRAFDGEKPAFDPILKEASLMPSLAGFGIYQHLQMLIDHVDVPSFDDGDDTSGWSKSVRNMRFTRGWTPVLEMDGLVWFVDHDPAEGGIDGQVFVMNIAEGCDYVEVVASSLADFLTDRIASS